MNQQEGKKLENKIFGILENYLKKNSILVVGISGGPDSTFLAHLLIEFKKSLSTKKPAKIVFAHLNHSLRRESNLDENFSKDFVEKLNDKNIIFVSKKVEIEAKSKKLKLGLEETGRIFRYKFFAELKEKYKADFVVTAHHCDDNLETIIMNFCRGTGLKGLIGIAENEKNLLRPLLAVSKKQIIEYLKFKKIPFRIDKSNSDPKFRRNFIRHKIIPTLSKINPNLSETIAENRENFKEIQDFLSDSARNWIKKNSLNKTNTRFNLKNWKLLHKALQKTIILEIYKFHVNNSQNIEKKHFDEVLKLLQQNIGNKKKKFGKLIFYLKNNILEII